MTKNRRRARDQEFKIDLQKEMNQLTFMDDVLSRVAFSKDDSLRRSAAQRIVQTLLDRNDLEVVRILSQKEQAASMDSKITKLDLLALTKNGKRVRIEFQNNLQPWQSKRRSYYIGQDLSEMLESGQGYEDLDELIVLWINGKDEFGFGREIYPLNVYVPDLKGNLHKVDTRVSAFSISAEILKDHN